MKNIINHFLKLAQNQKIKFLAVGAYNTLFGLILGNSLLLLTSNNYVIIALIATYFIGLIHNFFTFEKLVFHSNTPPIKGIIKMNNTYIITAAIQVLIVSILVYHFKINDNIAYNITFPITLTIKYFLHQKYTFKSSFK